MQTLPPKNRLVGARLKRKEDPRLLRGRGLYVDDVRRPGTLHAAFVRSDLAHGRLLEFDLSAARESPGVHAVFDAQAFEGSYAPMISESNAPSFRPSEVPLLARDKVTYVGQIIALVVAETRQQAEDAAELIVPDYDPLPAVLDLDRIDEAGVSVHESIPDNIYNHFHVTQGDIEAAFERADLEVVTEVRPGRCAAVSMEARAILAEADPLSDEITIWASHQAPHVMRSGLAKFLRLPETAIRIISPDVGGGFGVKLIIYPEDLAVILASRALGRPVKWTSDRREDLVSTLQGREQIHRLRAAVTKEGRILGIRTEIKASNGAFSPWLYTAALDSGQASDNVPGPYDIGAYERDVTAFATNKPPMGPYRGVGRVAACFSIERTMDEIGRRLGIEPIEVRKRNVVREYPYETIAGLVLESGSSAQCLDAMEELLDLPNFRIEQAELRKAGIYRGVGIAAVAEHTSLGPQEVSKKGVQITLGYETASVRVEPDGHVTLLVGTHSHGQGHATTFAQVVGDELGISHEDVRVLYGDTSVTPYGIGTWASRSLVFAGGAAILACRDIRAKAIATAAFLWGVEPDLLVYDGGILSLKSDASRQMSLAEVARILNHQIEVLPDAIEPGLDATRRYRAPDPGTFSNSLHAAVVDVDIVTGSVAIQRYVVIEDCGTIVNPLVVEGQLIGGVAQGIGQALFEEVVFDEGGQPLSTTLADYLLPTAVEVPRIEIHHLETPSPHTLGGFKGMGEGGAINAPAAIANAVTDALSPFGIAANHTPITPAWISSSVAAARQAEAVSDINPENAS